MNTKFVETTEQRQQFEQALANFKDVPGSLMMTMQKAQEIYGYLPIEIQSRIADAYDVPLAEIYGIATFYTQFNIHPVGKHKVGVCLGTACYVKGAAEILEEIQKQLGINPGETSKDGKFTLDATRCVGCCGLAPLLTVDDKVYGNITAADVEKIINQY